LILLTLIAVVLASSCAKGKAGFRPPAKLFPETELTYAPVEFDTTSFRIHFFWNGFDDDGEVTRFHFATDSLAQRPPSEWPTTAGKDTTLLFLVDPVKELKVHVFKVAAEDNDGKIDPTPATRSFSAKTIPPRSQIEKGPAYTNPRIGPNFTFEWSGIDPDGGETGGKVPVDSFQYLLLRPGGIADTKIPPDHDPLPAWGGDGNYVKLIQSAVGDALPAGSAIDHTRWDDWKWIGIRALKHRFRNVTPGDYVFAERAVDIAGATEKGLGIPEASRNIRHFTVTNRNAGPRLVVSSSILNRPLASATGPDDYARKQLEIFEGETISFSWTATAEDYGGEIVGYTYALDDTSSFPGLDVRQTGATFQPSRLPPGSHFLYVRTMDDGGLVTNFVLPLLVVHPDFKNGDAQRLILFVDDSAMLLGNGSGPTDATETAWWTTRGPDGGPLLDLGPSYQEWDTLEQGFGSVEGRKQPPPSELKHYSTVVWTTDAQNGASIQTALFKTVAGGDYSELEGYLRAGGTLILTGWNLAQNTSGTENLTYKVGGPAPNGICTTFAPGSREYQRTIFPRMFMGIDNSYPANQAGQRSDGSADFVRGIPTPTGVSFGFDTARVDTGNEATGVQYPNTSGPSFKWNTRSNPPPGQPNLQLSPGLPLVEGWILATNFGCIPIQNFGFENPAAPIVQPIYTYHGVRENVLQDGVPSPREGLVCGTLVQSHDLATNGGRYVPTAAVGRIALFTFPLYFLKDADAINIMKKAFAYVNASPTLPPAGP